MSQVTIHLSNELKGAVVNKDLEAIVKRAVENAYSTNCTVRVSTLAFSQKIGPGGKKVDAVVGLMIEGLVADDFEDVVGMVSAAVDAIAFYFGSAIDRKDVSVTVRSTIQNVIKVELP